MRNANILFASLQIKIITLTFNVAHAVKLMLGSISTGSLNITRNIFSDPSQLKPVSF